MRPQHGEERSRGAAPTEIDEVLDLLQRKVDSVQKSTFVEEMDGTRLARQTDLILMLPSLANSSNPNRASFSAIAAELSSMFRNNPSNRLRYAIVLAFADIDFTRWPNAIDVPLVVQNLSAVLDSEDETARILALR